MSDVTFKKLPGVLSFQRGFVISDGLFFSVDNDGLESPVDVVRHGIRGTQNINNDSKTEVSNIQVTESAKSDSNACGVKVRFSLRTLALSDTLFACAGAEQQTLRQALQAFIERAKASVGIEEVARRYARNILNGRWLWRNRILGESIMIQVYAHQEPLAQSDNALSISLQHFDTYSQDEMTLGKAIAENMRGVTTTALDVEAHILFGFTGAVELFPSQNYVENKPSGFARPLYKVGHPSEANRKGGALLNFSDIRVMGQAALRDQKIGNALRTIDTWYPTYGEHTKPIPVEPNGASLDAQMFFRREGNDKKFSAFDLMRRINHIDPDTADGMFLIASLMRGGVFSETEKAEKTVKNKEGAKDAA